MKTTETTLKTLPTPFGLTSFEPVTFIYAHPDDELMNGTALYTLAGRGQPLDVVYLTNGEKSTKGPRDIVETGRRREEALSALATYGILPSQVSFMGLPDGQLHEREVSHEMLDRFISRLLETDSRTIITTGERGCDDHIDHISAHHVAISALKALRRGGAVWGLSDVPGEENFIVDPFRKMQSLAQHRSQFDSHAAAANRPDNWISFAGHDISVATAHELAKYARLFDHEQYRRAYPATDSF